MCRFLLFAGHNPILLADLLTRPAHSIINQSYDSKLRLDLVRPLNGDGFGVGWYPTAPSRSNSSPVQQQSQHRQQHQDSFQSLENISSFKQRPYLKQATSAALSPRVTIVRGQNSCTSLAGDMISAAVTAEEEHVDGAEEVEPHILESDLHSKESEFNLMKIYSAEDGPCVFTSILPAWNNMNLIRMSEKIHSKLIFAHVRAASPGFPISETNCHPWSYGRWMWMHNGYIAQFRKIKRKLQALLKEELFLFVQGSTDSEWVFALFLNQFDDPLNRRYTTVEIREALLNTIAVINQLSREENIRQTSLMNFAVTDGKSIICCRYVNSKTDEPASLFFSSGSQFAPASPGVYRMVKSDRREDVIIISSEPLTHERNDWIAIPANTIISITPNLNMLFFPIEDEFYNINRKRAVTKIECS